MAQSILARYNIEIQIEFANSKSIPRWHFIPMLRRIQPLLLFANQAFNDFRMFGSIVPFCGRIVRGFARNSFLSAAVVKLTKLTPKQAEYLGVPLEGPYKPDNYRC